MITVKSESYARKVNAARVPAEGIDEHLAQLAGGCLDKTFVRDLDDLRGLVDEIDACRERLKAEQKSTTVPALFRRHYFDQRWEHMRAGG